MSWYEAAAYAKFVGKRLPTEQHWIRAAVGTFEEVISPQSNFDGEALAPVGSYPAVHGWGVKDLAGSAKEWLWNEIGEERRIAGGAWNEPTCGFRQSVGQPPFSRQPEYGFRVASYEPAPDLEAPLQVIPYRDYPALRPVDGRTFEIYTSFFDYSSGDLDAKLVATDDSSPYWRKEKVEYNAAYGNERIPAYLFVPRGVPGPHQVALFFPGSGTLRTSSSQQLHAMGLISPVIRSGRAVLYPVYKGTYERRMRNDQTSGRDRGLQWHLDVHRSVDYLESRPDINAERLAYYGHSLGVMPAGQLAVGRSSEARRSLVANAVEGKSAHLFLPPQSVRQTQVGVAHHAEDLLDAPGGHRLGHHVGDCANVRRLRVEPNIYPVLADLDGKRLHAIVVASRRLARRRIEIPPVPWATQEAVLDGALAQGAPLVRTAIVEGAIPAFVASHAHRSTAACHRLYAAIRELIRAQRLLPNLFGSHEIRSIQRGAATKYPAQRDFELGILPPPCGGSPPRRSAEPRWRIMTREEVLRGLSKLKLRERLIRKLTVFGGLRPGEIFALPSNAVKIEQRVHPGSLDTPKSRASSRLAAIPATLLSELQAVSRLAVGDTVGDPFNGTSGPSVNVLIELMSIVALIVAPPTALD